MITGDKMETAENIGYLAKLIKEDFKVVRLAATIADLRVRCEDLLIELEKDNRLAVLVEGRQITNMVQEKLPYYIDIYTKILLKAKSVIFCRSSPKEKAEIVRFVK
jgi:phospholipid-translocating ATPase